MKHFLMHIGHCVDWPQDNVTVQVSHLCSYVPLHKAHRVCAKSDDVSRYADHPGVC
jgi:hypothetical protein